MRSKIVVACLVGCCLLLAFTGCQGDNNDANAGVDVTGHWSGTAEGGAAIAMDLIQTGSDVTGTSTGVGETGQLSGSVYGNVLSFNITWPSGPTTAGSGAVNGNNMTGTFSESGQSGTFTLTRY